MITKDNYGVMTEGKVSLNLKNTLIVFPENDYNVETIRYGIKNVDDNSKPRLSQSRDLTLTIIRLVLIRILLYCSI
jgi:hypothetical protein